MSFEYYELSDLDKSFYVNQLQGWSTGWYIDKKRDISIWGGVSARNWQEMAEGNYNHHYRLRLGNCFSFYIEARTWFRRILGSPICHCLGFDCSVFT